MSEDLTIESIPETSLPSLIRVILDLQEFYTPAQVHPWLTRPNDMLNGERAIDLIKRGQGDEVLAAIERLASGAYV